MKPKVVILNGNLSDEHYYGLLIHTPFGWYVTKFSDNIYGALMRLNNVKNPLSSKMRHMLRRSLNGTL